MPKKTTRTFKKKTWKKSGKKSYRAPAKLTLHRMLNTMPIGGLPQARLVRLRHCQEISIDAGSNSYAKKVFWLNCPANCTGDQTPKAVGGFSTWHNMYRKCTVLGAKIQFQFCPPTSSQGSDNFAGGFMGIYVSSSSSEIDDVLVNGVTELLEQPRNTLCKAIPHGPSTQNKDCFVTKYVDVAQFFGVTQSALITAEDDYGTTDQNPDKKIYASLYSTNIADNNPTALIGLVTIDMVIRFQEPRDVRAQ
jgi:hypothetical protein